jgi:glycosyltransferase involved in cell wall biosynthesis
MPRCSVVIRACNEEKYLGRLLTGLLRQSCRDLEIVLVDSGSTDSTVAIASRYPVRVVHFPKDDFTFGRSLNFGIEHTAGELVVVASAHVYPLYEDWIERLLAPFEDPQVGLTYGKQRGNEITKFSERRIFERWFPDEPIADQRNPFCNNANAAVRRSVWRDLRYDETLTGLEDLDFARRLQHVGQRIAYVPEAVIAHIHEERPLRIYNRYRREAIALARIMPAERFHAWDFLRLLIGNVVSDAYHAAQQRMFWANIAGIATFRLMQFWGTYRGFVGKGPVTSDLKRKFYYPTALERPARPPDTASRRIEYAELPEEPGDGR